VETGAEFLPPFCLISGATGVTAPLVRRFPGADLCHLVDKFNRIGRVPIKIDQIGSK